MDNNKHKHVFVLNRHRIHKKLYGFRSLERSGTKEDWNIVTRFEKLL